MVTYAFHVISVGGFFRWIHRVSISSVPRLGEVFIIVIPKCLQQDIHDCDPARGGRDISLTRAPDRIKRL